METFVPGPGQNVPRIALHSGLCECSDCFRKRRSEPREPIEITPWLPSIPAHRDGPVATISYGDVTIRLSLDMVHDLQTSILVDRESSFFLSNHVLSRALRAIEERMWEDIDVARKAAP